MENTTTAQLEYKAKMLKELCASLDPFSPLSEDEKKTLKEFNFELNNPYKLTNQLIFALENTIEELARRQGDSSIKVH